MPGVALAPEEIYDPLRKAADAPKPGFLEGVGAAFRAAEDTQFLTQAPRNADAYRSLLDTLQEQGVDISQSGPMYKDVKDSMGFTRRIFDRDAIFAEVNRQKARRPGAFKEVAPTRAEYEKAVATRNGGNQRDERTASRAGFVPQLIGGAASAMTEPVNLATMPAGGGATLAKTMLIGGMVSGGSETFLLPGTKWAMEKMGREMTVRDALWQVGTATVGGAAFEGFGKVVGDNWGSISAAPKAVQEKVWAKIVPLLPEKLRPKLRGFDDITDDMLPDIAEALIGRDNLTEGEAQALNILRREADIDAASPYRPDGAGSGKHRSELQKATERLLALSDGRPVNPVAAAPLSPSSRAVARSTTSLTVPGKRGQIGYANDIYSYFKGKGLTDAQARGIAAGIHAESASNHNVRGGYKGRAVGIGQWLGPRRAELLRRYGPTPSRKQQLDFLWEELQGRDPGGPKVLAKADEAEVLRSYIVDFMRPARGPQTTGDMKRGLQALGRGGETVNIEDGPVGRAANDAPEVDPEIAIREQLARDAEGIDAERNAIAGMAGEVAPERLMIDGEAAPSMDIAPLPELRRELFPDETSWKIAQAQVEADELGLPEPVITRQSVWEDARAELTASQNGEVPGALYRDDIGPIDVKWGVAPAKGEPGYGLAKIVAKHPEVLDDLPAIIDGMDVVSRTDNRIQLESPDHKAAVRLDWDGKQQQWLLTAFEKKKGKAPVQRTTDVPDMNARDGSPTRGAADGIAQSDRQGKLAFDAPRPVMRPDDTALLDFDDPIGAGAVAQADSLMHDLKMLADNGNGGTEIRMDAEGGSETVEAMMKRLADEEAVIATIRGCL
jgi:Phage tail lysozyme/phage-Barnase-EndoU-ColicinE5/D-RelE like nuclease1